MNIHNTIVNEFLIKNNISYNYLYDIINKISLNNVYFADLYLQSISNESWFLDNSIIKECFYKEKQGIGIRVIKNNIIYFSCTNDITLESINKCINNLFNKKYNSQINLANPKNIFNFLKNDQNYYSIINPINNNFNEKKYFF
ncbi:PmbA/TldA family metallopeptidase [Enterobacteriaceae endosymbiont of Plateumaris braccata]|uniref:PmbA/TldA family metallopeptidase n=1 Tax=Enterobacteriaceae endosymbiont of Plateumaris braccata TaxID=2675793 RepID=UPI0014496A74|nr:DNA gyrase modulator [Enterobacteriaceae endosymbiont of Plateumaris braccata]QJC27983.1 hypothetical protein GJT80_00045 [Enterobacteriaceae endosymbiont of Plateumaris braccata]